MLGCSGGADLVRLEAAFTNSAVQNALLCIVIQLKMFTQSMFGANMEEELDFC